MYYRLILHKNQISTQEHKILTVEFTTSSRQQHPKKTLGRSREERAEEIKESRSRGEKKLCHRAEKKQMTERIKGGTKGKNRTILGRSVGESRCRGGRTIAGRSEK